MSCLTAEQLAALAIGAGAAGERDHLTGCATCADRLAEVEAALARVEAHLAPAPGHAAGRERLLSALADAPLPRTPSTLRRIVMDRRSWAATAAVAALALFLVLALNGGPSGVVLAEALKPFREAKSFRCEMVTVVDGKAVEAKKGLTIRLTWAAPGSLRSDVTVGGKLQGSFISPHGKAGLMIDHREKTYTPADGKPRAQEAALVRMVEGLAKHPAGREKPAGKDEIDGVKASRFDLEVKDGAGRPWRYRLWAHPETKRPVRVEFAMQPDKGPGDAGATVVRLDRFEWDVKTAGVFDTTPSAGYRAVALGPKKAMELATKQIVAALKLYRERTGGYPKMERFDGVKAVKDLEKAGKGKKVGGEALQGFVLMGVLESLGKEVVYRGKSVGPADRDKVLFRWRVEDGQYHVVYGDLRAETVSSARLKELEKE